MNTMNLKLLILRTFMACMALTAGCNNLQAAANDDYEYDLRRAIEASLIPNTAPTAYENDDEDLRLALEASMPKQRPAMHTNFIPVPGRENLSFGTSARSIKTKVSFDNNIRTETPRMEDRVDELITPTGMLFGLFDGHGGEACVDYIVAGNRLLRAAAQNGLSNAFETVDNNFRRRFPYGSEESFMDSLSGSTATVVYVEQGAQPRLTIAWAGDSRAVVARPDGTVRFATADHRPGQANERARIDRLATDPSNRAVKGTNGEWRTAGLAVSRALGDASVKEISPGVIATPEIAEIPLTEDLFIILASDGVWDVIDNETAAGIVADILNGPNIKYTPDTARDTYQERGSDAKLTLAARALRDMAEVLGSTDNIAVTIIKVDQPRR